MVFYQQIFRRLCSVIKVLIVSIIVLYQKGFSPYLGKNCRFYPSCSQYMIDSIRFHGLVWGMYLAVKRLLKCHPAFKGGYDPIPEKKRLDDKQK